MQTSALAIGHLDRRHLLRWATASGAFFAMHGLNADEPPPIPVAKPSSTSGHRILAIELLSGVSLATMRDFYGRLLGLPIVEDREDRLTIAAGQTKLMFRPAASGEGEPFYHFAFNIPANKIRSATLWQKERTPLLPIPERLRDPQYPSDVVNYAHWNAHSIFFFDPAGNVVEYIARHDLKNDAPGDFSAADILYASEIAFVADDVPAISSQIKKFVGIDQYRGGNDEFTALGDEHGLVLVMKRGRVISFDSPDRKAVAVFRTAAKLRGPRPGSQRLSDQPYDLTVESG